MRTEEDKLCQSGIEVTLGGETYSIRPLVIKESREWRKKVAEVLGILPRYAGITTDTPDAFKNAIDVVLTEMPDRVCDLFFSYAKDLNRDEIESVATDDEIAAGFNKLTEVAFPLARSVVGMMGRVAQ